MPALDGGYVLRGAVGGVAGYLLRAYPPQEAGAPEQVEHRRVLGDLKRGDQSVQDDPRLAAIDDVVSIVAEV